MISNTVVSKIRLGNDQTLKGIKNSFRELVLSLIISTNKKGKADKLELS